MVAWALRFKLTALKKKTTDYRGEEFKHVEKLVKNNNDLLNISKPDLVTEIHE